MKYSRQELEKMHKDHKTPFLTSGAIQLFLLEQENKKPANKEEAAIRKEKIDRFNGLKYKNELSLHPPFEE